MMESFSGKQIRDQILNQLKSRIEKMDQKPGLAVFCIGDDPVCSKYVALKKKQADKIGVNFFDFTFGANISQEEIIARIEELNADPKISGIMIQMPIPEKFDKFEIVHAIAPEKDVDGLRFCCSYKSNYKPPVVLAILEAIQTSSICYPEGQKGEKSLNRNYNFGDLSSPPQDDNMKMPQDAIAKCLKNKKIVVVGRGFLVGWPLAQCLEEYVSGIVVADENTTNLAEITMTADILISAVGKHGIIQSNMIKDGAILIDAGTTEVSGELLGDIDTACYEKASFYTPVPGGIGPVTVAKLFENLVK